MISTLLTATREKAVETTEITEVAVSTRANEDNKESKDSEYQKNLARVPYIQYLITFWRESVLALFNPSSEVNIIYLTFA